MIPRSLFYLLLEARTSAQAEEQLIAVQASALGSGMAWGGKDSSKTRNALRRLSRAAYPEV